MTFYTYLHLRADDKRVFYVGKGKGKRAYDTRGRSKWWKGVAEKHGCIVQIVSDWPSEGEAFSHERLLIECLREARHPLVNMTDGGEGFAGGKHSLEWRENLSKRTKGQAGRPQSQETKVKLRAAFLGRSNLAWKGRKHSQASIQKRTAARLAGATKFEAMDGVRRSAREWSLVLGLHISTIHYRIKTGKLKSVGAI